MTHVIHELAVQSIVLPQWEMAFYEHDGKTVFELPDGHLVCYLVLGPKGEHYWATPIFFPPKPEGLSDQQYIDEWVKSIQPLISKIKETTERAIEFAKRHA